MPKIHIKPLSLILIPAVLLDPSGGLASTVLSALLHELGHLIPIMALGIGARKLTVTPYGLEIEVNRKYRSFGEEITVNLGGCVVNFITFILFKELGGFLHTLAYASLVLGVLNSLPVLSLDGGQALLALLGLCFSFRNAQRLARIISFMTLAAMWTLSAYIFLFSGYNYSLFIMSVWLFAKIYIAKG